MKRYRVDFGYGRYFFEERDDGDWVRFEDAQTVVAPMALAIKTLRDELTAMTLQRDILQSGLNKVSEILHDLSKELT